jgi:transmembrane sensor
MDNNIVKRKADLITRYLKGSLSPMEHQELEEWISESDDNRHLFESLTDPENLRIALNRYDEKRKKILNKIQASIAINNIHQSAWWSRWRRWITGAGIAAILLAGGWILWPKKTFRQIGIALPERFRNEVLPGSEQAKLTLDDRSVIILVDTVNGVLATDASGRTRVFKENGWLSYYSTDPGDSLYFNTLCVPRKGQYRVALPDGSRVWLNAGSSLRYPVVFGSKERRVELKGEAYFEVTSLPTPLAGSAAPLPGNVPANLPFVVSLSTALGNAEIQALGTRFNVKAYDDEAHFQATLLEGSAKLVQGANVFMLRPGQQGLFENNGQIAVYNNVNTAEVIAWKQGLFRFKDANIDQIMEQVERWYDVEVIYKDNINGLFTGAIERNTPLSQLLRYLEQLNQVRFTITGNKIIVMH